MSLHSLVVVLVRLVALEFLLRVAEQSPPLIPQLFRGGFAVPIRTPDAWVVAAWLGLAGLVGTAAALWVLAPSVARMVTRGVPDQLSFGPVSLVDGYSIAFTALGLWFVGGAFPEVVTWTVYLLRTAASTTTPVWSQDVRWEYVSRDFIGLIVGAVVFVKGRAWGVALARKQQSLEATERAGR